MVKAVPDDEVEVIVARHNPVAQAALQQVQDPELQVEDARPGAVPVPPYDDAAELAREAREAEIARIAEAMRVSDLFHQNKWHGCPTWKGFKADFMMTVVYIMYASALSIPHWYFGSKALRMDVEGTTCPQTLGLWSVVMGTMLMLSAALTPCFSAGSIAMDKSKFTCTGVMNTVILLFMLAWGFWGTHLHWTPSGRACRAYVDPLWKLDTVTLSFFVLSAPTMFGTSLFPCINLDPDCWSCA